MLPRIVRLVVVLLIVGQVVPFAPTQNAGATESWFDEELRRWDWNSPAPEVQAFLLAPSEAHSRYYFVLLNDAAPVSETVGVANIQVTHAITGDPVCGRPVAAVDGEYHVHLPCHDLRIGHTYRVEILRPTQATLFLFGEDP